VREQLQQSLLRDGVAATTATALKDMKIRRYSFTGAEVGADKPDEPDGPKQP
jgi:hypothetical protein